MKNKFRIIAVLMLLVAIVFFVYAISNPQFSWPWNNGITYTIYGVYVFVMVALFIISFKK